MTEEEKATTPAEMEESEQPAPEIAQQQRRVTSMKWLIYIGAISVAITLAFYLVLYFQTGAWQVLAEVGGVLLAGVSLAVAYWLIPTRKGWTLPGAVYWPQ